MNELPEVVAAREKVNVLRPHWPALIEMTDGEVSLSWMQKFARGEISNPTVVTLRSVESACDALLTRIASEKAAV